MKERSNTQQPGFPQEALEALLPLAFAEDVGEGDVTTQATVPENHRSEARLLAKETGVIAGLPIIEKIFNYRSAKVDCRLQIQEGGGVRPGDLVATMEAETRVLLECERILLNFLQHLSGVATGAHAYSQAVEGTSIAVLDTRKTLPGYRALDKYAVRVGGAQNHRRGLYDHILIKDNHKRAAGSVRQAVMSALEKFGSRYPLEAEIESLEELETILDTKVQWVLLDNMSDSVLRQAVDLLRQRAPRIKIEISGNMTLEKVRSLRNLNVDYISVGRLTHSVSALDLSLKF